MSSVAVRKSGDNPRAPNQFATAKASGKHSKIDIRHHLSTNSSNDTSHIEENLLYFWILRKTALRPFVSRGIGIGHNDQPVALIRTSLKAAQPIANAAFEVEGSQTTGQRQYFVDRAASVVRNR
jgi:hypothetical protein